MANLDDLKMFQRFLAMMEEASRTARDAGKSAEEAAAEYKLEGEFADWYVFSEQVIPRVFAAWYREFDDQ